MVGMPRLLPQFQLAGQEDQPPDVYGPPIPESMSQPLNRTIGGGQIDPQLAEAYANWQRLTQMTVAQWEATQPNLQGQLSSPGTRSYIRHAAALKGEIDRAAQNVRSHGGKTTGASASGKTQTQQDTLDAIAQATANNPELLTPQQAKTAQGRDVSQGIAQQRADTSAAAQSDTAAYRAAQIGFKQREADRQAEQDQINANLRTAQAEGRLTATMRQEASLRLASLAKDANIDLNNYKVAVLQPFQEEQRLLNSQFDAAIRARTSDNTTNASVYGTNKRAFTSQDNDLRSTGYKAFTQGTSDWLTKMEKTVAPGAALAMLEAIIPAMRKRGMPIPKEWVSDYMQLKEGEGNQQLTASGPIEAAGSGADNGYNFTGAGQDPSPERESAAVASAGGRRHYTGSQWIEVPHNQEDAGKIRMDAFFRAYAPYESSFQQNPQWGGLAPMPQPDPRLGQPAPYYDPRPPLPVEGAIGQARADAAGLVDKYGLTPGANSLPLGNYQQPWPPDENGDGIPDGVDPDAYYAALEGATLEGR